MTTTVRRYITPEQLMQGRDTKYPTTEQMEADAAVLCFRVNSLLAEYLASGGSYAGISSGYRPGKYNVAAGGSLTSTHLVCQAVDIFDPGDKFDTWLDAKGDAILAKYQLCREPPSHTKGWVHLDIRNRNGWKTFTM